MILADKIIEERKRIGLSQEELAERLNVSRQSVSKWESAQSIPDINRIIMLAEILIENKEYKEAEKYYQGIIKKDENITQDELYTYVYLLLCLNNYIEARNILEKMLKVKEKSYLLINIRTD